MMPETTDQIDGPAIARAEMIIERFGGIRPMASKMAVPVTTVQGWKKRGVIPGNRRADILSAAAAHQIDIADLLTAIAQNGGTANENVLSAAGPAYNPFAQTEEIRVPERENLSPPPVFSGSKGPHVTQEDLVAYLKKTEKKAVTKSALITLGLSGAIAAALLALLWPGSAPTLTGTDAAAQQKIAALEAKITEMEQQQSTLSAIIPSDLTQTISDLKEQTKGIREGMGAALTRAEDISADVLSADAGTLEQRIAKLEAHAAEIAASPAVTDMLQRWGLMEATAEGQAQLRAAITSMSAAFAGLPKTILPVAPGEEDPVILALSTARAQDLQLAQTFEGVPASDLKAAAYLLAMTQMRSSLNRDNQPFAEDMKVLMSLVGEEDAALKASLEKLAPQAEKGVLTPGGLSNELRSLTGDIVVASLSGENVSIQERAQAKFGELLQIEKNGEPVTGTPTQAAISKSQSLLESGDLAGAIASMKTLQGPALATASSWINQAEASLMAQNIKSMLTQTLQVQASRVGSITANGNLQGRTNLVQDPASGTNVLQIPAMPPAFKLKPAGVTP